MLKHCENNQLLQTGFAKSRSKKGEWGKEEEEEEDK